MKLQLPQRHNARRHRPSQPPNARGTAGEGPKATGAWCAFVPAFCCKLYINTLFKTCFAYTPVAVAGVGAVVGFTADCISEILACCACSQVIGCGLELSQLNKPYCLRKGICPSCMKVREQLQEQQQGKKP